MAATTDDVYLEAGKIIVFSTGSYSDYGYNGMYVTLRPLLRSQLHEIARQTSAEHERLDEEHSAWFSLPRDERVTLPCPTLPELHELFETNLIRAGLLMIVDYREMHVGDYGRIELAL